MSDIRKVLLAQFHGQRATANKRIRMDGSAPLPRKIGNASQPAHPTPSTRHAQRRGGTAIDRVRVYTGVRWSGHGVGCGWGWRRSPVTLLDIGVDRRYQTPDLSH